MANERDDSIVSFLLGLTAGVIGGTVAGLLLAPKSGDELREDINAFVKDLPDKLDNEITNPEGNTRNLINRAKINIEARVDQVKKDREADRQQKAKMAEELASGYEYNR